MMSPIPKGAVDRWVERGIITPEQRDAILHDLAANRPLGAGLTLPTLLYYGGGLLALIAYAIFLGVQWADLNSSARIAISAASLLAFGVIAEWLLRTPSYRLPGELLQLVAVAIVPLFVFALLDAAGIWPHDPSRYTYQHYYQPASGALRRQYQVDLTWARMGLAGATMAGALVAFRLSRSPFVLIAAIVSVISLFLDATIQIQGSHLNYTWHAPQALVVATIGAAVLAAGILLRNRTERDYSPWLLVTGLAALAVGLSFKTFPENAAGWGALWVIVALVILALSVPLQERLFAVAGLAAIFAYCAKLVFDVFQDATAALGMALLGLLVLGAGLLYQRFISGRMTAPEPRR
jgi:hypothetical protein